MSPPKNGKRAFQALTRLDRGSLLQMKNKGINPDGKI
jgi:hypothetical protein